MGDLDGLWGDKSQAEMAEEARGSFTVLPPGWTPFTIVGTELKATKDGNGRLLEVTLEAAGGDNIVDRLNIKNNSTQAQTIGRQQLAKLAIMAGVPSLTDSLQLHGLKVEGKVEVEEFKSNTSGKPLKSNKISDYRKAGAYADKPAAASADSGW